VRPEETSKDLLFRSQFGFLFFLSGGFSFLGRGHYTGSHGSETPAGSTHGIQRAKKGQDTSRIFSFKLLWHREVYLDQQVDFEIGVVVMRNPRSFFFFFFVRGRRPSGLGVQTSVGDGVWTFSKS
jgi:carbohydrate-selective porin OprB